MEQTCRTCDHGAIYQNMAGSTYEEVQCLYPLSHRDREKGTGDWRLLKDTCIFWKLKDELRED